MGGGSSAQGSVASGPGSRCVPAGIPVRPGWDFFCFRIGIFGVSQGSPLFELRDHGESEPGFPLFEHQGLFEVKNKRCLRGLGVLLRREAYSTIRKNFNNPCGFFNDPQEFQECPTRETILSILSNLKMEHIQQFRGIYTNHYTYSMIRKSSNNFQSAKEFEEFPTHQENGEA